MVREKSKFVHIVYHSRGKNAGTGFLARTVHLSVNGSLCGVFSVNGSLLISVSLPTEIVGTGELRIELEIEEMLLSPKELGMGEDPRKLGIFLSHIRLL